MKGWIQGKDRKMRERIILRDAYITRDTEWREGENEGMNTSKG